MTSRRSLFNPCVAEGCPAARRLLVTTARRFDSGRSGTTIVSGFVLAMLIAVPGMIAQADDEIPIMSGSRLGDAVLVEVEPRCSDIRLRSPEVQIRWTIDADAVKGLAGTGGLASATEFRLDTSKFYNGFETGRFDSVAVRAEAAAFGEGGQMKTSSANSAIVEGLRPGVYYHARVLVRTPDGWVPSAPTGFLSSTCPADGLDRE